MTDTPAHAEPTEDHPTRPLNFTRLDEAVMRERATSLYTCLDARRSVRFFSDAPVPLDVLRTAIHTAGTAPSGAHKQPWTFALVQIRRSSERFAWLLKPKSARPTTTA